MQLHTLHRISEVRDELSAIMYDDVSDMEIACLDDYFSKRYRLCVVFTWWTYL